MPKNIALAEAGAEVLSATCFDPQHPPAAVIDGSSTTFFASTGLFPQQLVLRLPSKSSLACVEIVGTSLKHIVLERCDGPAAVNWQPYAEQAVPDDDGALQTTTVSVPPFPATHLRLTITEGYADFVTIVHLRLLAA